MFTAKKWSFTWVLSWIVFGICLFLSTSFAIQLYTGLVDEPSDKFFLGLGSIVVEGIKILSLIIANTALFSASTIKDDYREEFNKGFFKRWNGTPFTETSLERVVLKRRGLINRAILMYLVYAFCTSVTLTGSAGFVLTHTSLRGENVSKVTNADVIDTQTATITTNKATVAQNLIDIAQNNHTMVTYSAQQDKVNAREDLTDDQKMVQWNALQAKIDTLLAKNRAMTNTNTALSNDSEKKATSATTLKGTDEKAKDAVKKDMYDLLSDATGIPAIKIRSTLLFLFASIIDIGLFLFSPHFNDLEERRVRMVPVQPEEVEEAPRVKRPYRRKPVEQKTAFTTSEALPTEEYDFVPMPEGALEAEGIVEEAPDELFNTEFSSHDPTEEFLDSLDPETAKLIHVSKDVESHPVEVPEIEELVKEPEPVLVPQVSGQSSFLLQVDRFIDALFDTGGKAELVERDVAARVSGLPLPQASEVFDFLVSHKKGAVNLIRFDNSHGVFYPVHHAGVIKKEVHDHLRVGLTPQEKE